MEVCVSMICPHSTEKRGEWNTTSAVEERKSLSSVRLEGEGEGEDESYKS